MKQVYLSTPHCQESCPRVTTVWCVGHHVSESHLSELWSYLPLIAGLTSSITHSGRWTGAMFPSSDTGPAMNCWIKLKSENLNITNLQSLLSIQEYEIDSSSKWLQYFHKINWLNLKMYKLEEKSNNKYVWKMISFELVQVFKMQYCWFHILHEYFIQLLHHFASNCKINMLNIALYLSFL